MLMSAQPPLRELENAGEFVARHLGIDPSGQARMLEAISAPSLAALIDAVVPRTIRRAQPMALPPVRFIEPS